MVELSLDSSFYFTTASDAFVDCIRTRGVAILRSAVVHSEVVNARKCIWNWLSSSYGARPDEPLTWRTHTPTAATGTCFAPSTAGGIVTKHGAGQSSGAWIARGAAGVQAAFARVWGSSTDQLISSMDGLILWRDWRRQPAGEQWQTKRGWLHRDWVVASAVPADASSVGLDPRRDAIAVGGPLGKWLPTVQGMVALSRTDASTGGFVCCPGEGFADAQLPWCYAFCESGDLVLWDSRCRHASEPTWDVKAMALAPEGCGGLLRMAIPVCMVPRWSATEEAPHANLPFSPYRRLLHPCCPCTAPCTASLQAPNLAFGALPIWADFVSRSTS